MAKTSGRQNKRKNSIAKKSANNILTLLFLIMTFGALINFCGKVSDEKDVAEIEAGDVINPPPDGLVLSSRQQQMIADFHREILDAKATFNDLSQRGSSDIAREAAKRDKEMLYLAREKAWNTFVSPTRFVGFFGRIEGLEVFTVSGGPNSGKTSLRIEIVLFGTGIVLQENMLIDERRDQWAERKISTPWRVLKEGLTVEISGNFIHASNERQWAMCCVSSTGYPKLAIDLSDLMQIE